MGDQQGADVREVDPVPGRCGWYLRSAVDQQPVVDQCARLAPDARPMLRAEPQDAQVQNALGQPSADPVPSSWILTRSPASLVTAAG